MPWKPDPNCWSPHPKQETWMRSPAFEVCVGGAAGPGKSAFVLAEALRHVHRPGYTALILRREATQLKKELVPAARELYPRVGGKWKASESTFYWPNGARIMLGGVEGEQDVRKYSGVSIQYLGWDEATHFTEWQYLFMFARLRASGLCPDVTPRIRSGTNPGSKGHDWVLARFAPWLYPRPGEPHHDPTYKGPFAKPGEILWYLRDEEGNERIVPPFTKDARSRSFYPGRVSDNPIYAGGAYEANLNAMALLDREQLRDGNWMARPSAGMFFKRAWFANSYVNVAPVRVVARVRYWDLAATPADRAAPGGAWTAGVLISKTSDGLFWIEDIVRGQWSPGMVEKTVLATAESDPEGTRIVIELDPGQAGPAQAHTYRKLLVGFDIHAVPPQGDKITRAKPASAQAEGSNIMLVRGEWNGPFLREAESFPEGVKDQIDSLSGGFNQIARLSGFRGKAGTGAPREMRANGAAF